MIYLWNAHHDAVQVLSTRSYHFQNPQRPLVAGDVCVPATCLFGQTLPELECAAIRVFLEAARCMKESGPSGPYVPPSRLVD